MGINILNDKHQHILMKQLEELALPERNMNKRATSIYMQKVICQGF